MNWITRLLGRNKEEPIIYTLSDGIPGDAQDILERREIQRRIDDEYMERQLMASLKSLEVGIELLRPEVQKITKRLKHER